MGYTHCWTLKTNISKSTWTKITADCRRVLANLPARYNGEELQLDDQNGGAPILDDNHIWFNGVGDLSHETFEVTRVPDLSSFDSGFSFCKTARKPYDLAVCACLLILKYYVPKLDLRSDGDASEWVDARTLVRQVLKIPLRDLWKPEK